MNEPKRLIDFWRTINVLLMLRMLIGVLLMLRMLTAHAQPLSFC
jgi:hypothetical protein